MRAIVELTVKTKKLRDLGEFSLNILFGVYIVIDHANVDVWIFVCNERGRAEIEMLKVFSKRRDDEIRTLLE